MAIKTFPAAPNAVIELSADANLMISVGPPDTVVAQIRNEESLRIETTENRLRLYAEDDMVLKVPAAADLLINGIEGSLTIAGITGSINIISVGGHLTLQGTGLVNCNNVSGHCKFSGTIGPIQVRNVGGNLRGSAAREPLKVSNVGGNIKLLDALLVEKVHAGGNIKAKFSTSPQDLEALAGGNIKLWLPVDSGFELEAHSGGEKVVMQLGGDAQRFSTSIHRATIGAGGPLVRLHSGGSIYILNSGWEEDLVPEDFVPDEDFSAGWTSSVLNDRIQQHIQAKIAQAEARASAASRRAEAKMEAAMRKMDRMNIPNFSGAWAGSVPPVPPVVPVSPVNQAVEVRPRVSDEERMIILNMLAEKKITAEEANRLLDALNGKFA